MAPVSSLPGGGACGVSNIGRSAEIQQHLRRKQSVPVVIADQSSCDG